MTCHQCMHYAPASDELGDVVGYCDAPACSTNNKAKPIYQPYQPGCRGFSFESFPDDLIRERFPESEEMYHPHTDKMYG